MDARSRTAFGALVAAQAAHSVEEYLARLYDVLGLARFLSGLGGGDRATGFAILNAGIVIFGVWCYRTRVRGGRPSARLLAWLWAVAELVNGLGHVALAAVRGGYFPGLGTAPLLVAISLYLIRRLTAGPPTAST